MSENVRICANSLNCDICSTTSTCLFIHGYENEGSKREEFINGW
jgi:hypothetical protein